jgi:large subunit ribosomal protein L16
MFELEGIPKDMAQKAMGLAAAKMPIRTKFVVRDDLQHAAAGEGEAEE